MKKLNLYAENPFKGIRVARSRFALFVLILIQRLTQSGVAAYNTIIAETTALYNLVFGLISQRDIDLTEQMTETKAVKQIRALFKEKMDDIEAAVRFHFKKKSLVYNEFFQQGGITDYKTAPLSSIFIKMTLIVYLVDKYKTTLGQPLLDEITQIKDDFETERNTQLGLIGSVKSVIPDYAAKKELMITQLHKNVLVIMIENINNTAVMPTFFEEQLIRFKHHKKDDENDEAYTLHLGKDSREIADISYSVDDTLVLNNTGLVPLSYFFAESADEVAPEHPSILAVDEEIEIKAVVAGAPQKRFLIFLNPSTTEEGDVEIFLM